MEYHLAGHQIWDAFDVAIKDAVEHGFVSQKAADPARPSHTKVALMVLS